MLWPNWKYCGPS
ncbi:hypothetical protein LINPERPRIM_LOCUS19932 [Linum perenne]